MIYFDSDMSKSTNTAFYIYVRGKCRTQCMLPMEKSVTFTGACANEILPSINRSFVYKAEKNVMLEILILFSGSNRVKTNKQYMETEEPCDD